MSELLNNLNGAQRDAVINYDSPSLIIAGAGSGKTRVLTCRIAYMLEKGIDPGGILALTFTNKAAREMRERISTMVSPALSRRLWMGTFHSVFARILRTEAASLGYDRNFTIYDAADSRNLVRRIIRDMKLAEEAYKPGEVMARISLAKNNLVTPQAYQANATLVGEDRQRKKPLIADIYSQYVRRCREYGAMDFDDLLLNMNILFKDHPEVTEKYSRMFQYILVDEYQDTNYAQYVIVRRLSQGHSRLCVVGDDAQSIYSFRGARIENILRFRSDYPTARLFKLEQNYRSTQSIVGAAGSLIKRNDKQIDKQVFSTGPVGEPVRVLKAYTDQEEAIMVADELRRMVQGGGGEWRQAAVLYRTNAQSRALEEAMRRRAIPYKIYGGMSFYQRKEIKDLLAYIRLVVNPRDEESLRRVINLPARGIGDVTVERIANAAAGAGVSMMEAMHTMDAATLGVNQGIGKRIAEFVAMIDDLSLGREQSGLYQTGLRTAVQSGLMGMYKADNSPEAMSALENIEELLASIHAFTEQYAAENDGQQPSLEEWLANVSLLTDADSEESSQGDHVTLMTVHAAKGLEFRYVVITGMEENLFPSQMSTGTPEGLEEERRLFYVALTRAKEVVAVSFATQRFKWGQVTFSRPSRFLTEIDSRFIDGDLLPDSDGDLPLAAAEPRGRFDHRRGPISGKPSSGAPSTGSFRRGGAAGPTTDNTPRIKPLDAAASNPRLRSLGTRPAGQEGDMGNSPAGPIQAGARVRHLRFGAGTVESAENTSADTKLIITFDDGTKRTLLQKFARLEVIK